MKKINILFITLLILFWISNTNANNDHTNAFSFTYDCVDGKGILKTDFDLGGHHHYNRQYEINQAGLIEIADDNHTTVAKSTNITIGNGCGFTGNGCTITSTGSWEHISGEDILVSEITIDTTLEIKKDGDNLIINGSGNTIETKIGFDNEYTGSGKNLELLIVDEKLELIEYGFDENGNEVNTSVRDLTFTNKKYNGIDEYYYDISSDNKNIKLMKKKFKRVLEGYTKSSENDFDIFSSYDGINTGGGTCSDPKGQTNNGYCTGLDFWDYTQHHYTTTKVKLYPVDIECENVEYSDGKTNTSYGVYNGTLSGIKAPVFSGPTTINGVIESNFGSTIYATGGLVVKGLTYKIVGEIGGKSIGVKKIQASLKADDITLGKAEYELPNIIDTVTSFPDMNFDIIDDNTSAIITKKAGNYQIVFTFFDDKGQQLGTYEIPLFIIPNNNLSLNGDLRVDETDVYATNNNDDKIKICQLVKEEFGNKINRKYILEDGNVQLLSTLNLDNVNNKGLNGLVVEDVIFDGGMYCFNIYSLAIGKNKKLDFKIKVPLHEQESSLNKNGKYIYFDIKTSEITFKKPILGELKLVPEDKNPQLGLKQKYQIKLDNIGKLNGFSKGKVEFTKNNMKNMISGHSWTDFELLIKNFGNNILKYIGFIGKIDAVDNLLQIPKIKAENLIISYNILGKTVKYYLEESETIGDCKIETLGLKFYGIAQGDGNSVATGQEENIGDLSKGIIKEQIKKNVYAIIKNRQSDKTKNINGVIYVVGDVKYSEVESNLNINDTIIVKDGNFIIDKDINKTIGIIVIKDNYDINLDYNKSGNVYVIDNVENIDAIIYTDGTFRSSNENGLKYDDKDLTKVLTLKGSLFTRNTIGGAIKINNKYSLPGDKKIDNYDLAEVYDLNYIRKISITCDGDNTNDYSFIIKYNPNIQINPPKVFDK